MPEDVLNPTISKRYATAISDNDLPLDNDRRIVVDGSGCCSLAYETKRAEELLDYFIDMMKWLEPNEVIIGASGWCDQPNLYVTRLEYAPTGVVAWLAGGGDNVRQTVNVQISTSLGKIKLVQFVVHTTGVAGALAIVTAEGEHVTVGLNKGTDPVVWPEAKLKAYPETLSFPSTAANTGSVSQTLVIKNDGNAVAYIRKIGMNGPFSQRNAGVHKLVPGDFTQITVTYKPKTLGQHTGSISIDIGKGLQEYAAFSGTAVSGNRLTVSGNQLVRPCLEAVRLKSVNWFGAESQVYAPHGLWARSYKDIIDQIAAMGFNCVRLPLSGDICNVERTVSTGVINTTLNPDLFGKKAIEVLDIIIGYMNQKGLYVVLDHHRCHAGDGADGSPIDESYSLDNWKSSWTFLAQRYSGLEFVLGADLHNEPHRLEWTTWAAYAEDCGNSILSIAPHWLIFVEGVARYRDSNYWWGGELSGVADRPVKLSVDGRLVYSVHEYGISVGSQPWLAKDGVMPAGWPYNLYNVWRKHWGFIVEQGIAPVWIGEVGGKFGVDGSGNVTNSENAQYERQWIYHLQRYMDGYFTGNNTRRLKASDQGISFAYWSLNPNSGDTGGLLQDDWTTEQSFKLELIGMMLNNMTLSQMLSLTPLTWERIDDDSQLIVAQDGKEFAVSLPDFITAVQLRLFKVGVTHFFATDVDPNALYSGQVWEAAPDLNIQTQTTVLAAWYRVS